MINWLSGTTVRVLERGLDTASLRHQVLANNIANVDTPGFKRSGINFADAMADALAASDFRGQRSDARHVEIDEAASPNTTAIVTEQDTFIRNDGNNVDIEREMAELAENSLLYNSMAQLLNKRFGQLRSAINDGRR